MPKAKLPTKTKIAAQWLIVIGIVLTIWSSWLLFVALINSIGIDAIPAVPNLVLYFFLPLFGIFTFLSGTFVFIEKKRSWQVAMAALFFAMICFLGIYLYSLINAVYYIIPLISLLGWLSCLTSLILIILDRKNYFEMVRQRDLKKKDSEREKPEGNPH